MSDVVVRRKPRHFKFEVTYYVPVFQKDFEEDGSLCSYPTFAYEMSMATKDEQMAASFNPDYILVLKGDFDAQTKPLVLKDDVE